MPNQKARYKVRNWSEYNNALVNRYNITLWLNEEVIKKWRHKGSPAQGAQKQYSDLAIETMLTFRSLLSLPLRATEGFIRSLAKQFSADIPIPDYSTLCRREGRLKIKIRQPKHSIKEPIDIVIDSTGLKVYGEGEWKVRMHGYSKHRTWRKLHIAVDPDTGCILAQTLTTNSIIDAHAAAGLITSLKGYAVDKLLGDRAYDRFKVYSACDDADIMPVIRPTYRARIRCGDAWRHRNDNVLCIRDNGLDYWKKVSGYTMRSWGEVAFSRYKRTFSDEPLSHIIGNQRTETAINCKILNIFWEIGRPRSYKIAA